jgi:hypothetical protein
VRDEDDGEPALAAQPLDEGEHGRDPDRDADRGALRESRTATRGP